MLGPAPPNPGSVSATGGTQDASAGNNQVAEAPTHTRTEPTLANFIDFENLLAQSDIPLHPQSHQTLPSINPQSSPPLTATAQIPDATGGTINFSTGEEILRLGAEDMSSHVPAQLCQKIWSHQYINIALLLKGNVELQDLCSGGLLHITDKGQLETRPKVTREKISNIEKWTDAFFVYLLQAFS